MAPLDTTTIRELRSHPEQDNWHAKLQTACINFWASLPATGEAEQEAIDLFIELLRLPHALELAQLVIVDLRVESGDDISTLSPSKQRILNALLLAISGQPWPQPQDLQGRVDSASYRAEKYAFFEADIHRTKLFLRRTENFTVEEELAIIEWLKACPVKPKTAQSKGEQEPAHDDSVKKN